MVGQIATGLFVHKATGNMDLSCAAFLAVFAICAMIHHVGLKIKER
jgi:ribose/xylose/arabinose/galactoside ABC-type transport system permease subunit